MKYIFFASSLMLSFSVSAATATPSSQCGDLADRLEMFLTTRQVTVTSAEWRWQQLDHFHAFFLEAMALDPAQVPLEKTPLELHHFTLDVALQERLDALVESRHIADRLAINDELDSYVSLVEKLLAMRTQGFYTRARRIVKRGPLHNAYQKLIHRMNEEGSRSMELKVAWKQDASLELIQEMQILSNTFQVTGARSPASNIATSNVGTSEQFAQLRMYFFVLIGVVFMTGTLAGVLWSRRRQKH